jgi:hypothetical protein
VRDCLLATLEMMNIEETLGWSEDLQMELIEPSRLVYGPTQSGVPCRFACIQCYTECTKFVEELTNAHCAISECFRNSVSSLRSNFHANRHLNAHRINNVPHVMTTCPTCSGKGKRGKYSGKKDPKVTGAPKKAWKPASKKPAAKKAAAMRTARKGKAAVTKKSKPDAPDASESEGDGTGVLYNPYNSLS